MVNNFQNMLGSIGDSTLLSNPIFSGGFGLALLATGAQALRLGSTMGMNYLKRYYLVTLEVIIKLLTVIYF